MRADLIIDMDGKPGEIYRVIDDFYEDLAYKLIDLAYAPERPARDHSPNASRMLPANPLPEPDLPTAERYEIALQGGIMGGMGMMSGGSMMGGTGMMGMGGATWAMNGVSMTGDGQSDMPPLVTLKRGQTCVLAAQRDCVVAPDASARAQLSRHQPERQTEQTPGVAGYDSHAAARKRRDRVRRR
jgi:hypothetical protein